jgi:hypothetical protein
VKSYQRHRGSIIEASESLNKVHYLSGALITGGTDDQAVVKKIQEEAAKQAKKLRHYGKILMLDLEGLKKRSLKEVMTETACVLAAYPAASDPTAEVPSAPDPGRVALVKDATVDSRGIAEEIIYESKRDSYCYEVRGIDQYFESLKVSENLGEDFSKLKDKLKAIEEKRREAESTLYGIFALGE